MALYTKTGSDIPADAVRLGEQDAIKFMSVIVESWKNRSDVLYLTYSPGILSGLSALTGMYYNNYYRSKLRLMSFGRMSTYLPIVVIPAFASFATYAKSVQSPILIEKYTCPVCLEIRASVTQVLTGVAYPLAMAPILGFMMASRYYTYNVPDVRRDPKSLYKLLLRFSKPIRGITIGITALHCALASFLTYKQVMEISYIKTKLMEAEEEEEISKG